MTVFNGLPTIVLYISMFFSFLFFLIYISVEMLYSLLNMIFLDTYTLFLYIGPGRSFQIRPFLSFLFRARKKMKLRRFSMREMVL